jgi:hypothetical protein
MSILVIPTLPEAGNPATSNVPTVYPNVVACVEEPAAHTKPPTWPNKTTRTTPKACIVHNSVCLKSHGSMHMALRFPLSCNAPKVMRMAQVVVASMFVLIAVVSVPILSAKTFNVAYARETLSVLVIGTTSSTHFRFGHNHGHTRTTRYGENDETNDTMLDDDDC